MKILVYDLENFENDIYDLISKHLNINFIKTKDKDIFFSHYKHYDINDIIVIDVTQNIGEEIFNYITKTKVKQKILVISKSLSYNHTFTCEECFKQFNRKLLLKPINPKLLIFSIQNFDKLLCGFSSDSNEIIEIMDEILEQFMDYKYVYETKVIEKKYNYKSNVKELINITELLETLNIRYSILNENIKLHF